MPKGTGRPHRTKQKILGAKMVRKGAGMSGLAGQLTIARGQDLISGKKPKKKK